MSVAVDESPNLMAPSNRRNARELYEVERGRASVASMDIETSEVGSALASILRGLSTASRRRLMALKALVIRAARGGPIQPLRAQLALLRVEEGWATESLAQRPPAPIRARSTPPATTLAI